MLLADSGPFRIVIFSSLKVRYAPGSGPSRDRLLDYRFVPKADPNATEVRYSQLSFYQLPVI